MNIHDQRLDFKAFQKLSSDTLTVDALEIGASGVEASERSMIMGSWEHLPNGELGRSCILEDPEKWAIDDELLITSDTDAVAS